MGYCSADSGKNKIRRNISGKLEEWIGNTGSSVNELKKVVLQMSVYAGFPSAINGMNALKEVLDEGKWPVSA